MADGSQREPLPARTVDSDWALALPGSSEATRSSEDSCARGRTAETVLSGCAAVEVDKEGFEGNGASGRSAVGAGAGAAAGTAAAGTALNPDPRCNRRAAKAKNMERRLQNFAY